MRRLLAELIKRPSVQRDVLALALEAGNSKPSSIYLIVKDFDKVLLETAGY